MNESTKILNFRGDVQAAMQIALLQVPVQNKAKRMRRVQVLRELLLGGGMLTACRNGQQPLSASAATGAACSRTGPSSQRAK
jgi:hypothetical protein